MKQLLTFCLVAIGCSGCGAAPLKPPCDEATALQMGAVCAFRVQTECLDHGVPENECEAVRECDEKADARQRKCMP